MGAYSLRYMLEKMYYRITFCLIRVIKSRRMRWAGHVARMGRGKAYTGVWWGNLKKRDHLGDPGVDGRIILGWIFRKWDVGDGLDRAGSG